MAFDSGGVDAVRPWVQPADMAEQYPALFTDLMGWDAELWAQAAPPTFPCLVDADHLVARLYGMPNVPMAVWIDEEGRIVRSAEPAGVGDAFRSMDVETFTMPPDAEATAKSRRRAYLDAVRDWAAKGAGSVHAQKPPPGGRPMTADQAEAGAHFLLALALHRRGEVEAAQASFAEAGRLNPRSWAIRRQGMQLNDPVTYGGLAAGPDFFEAVGALGDKRYYEPILMEGFDA